MPSTEKPNVSHMEDLDSSEELDDYKEVELGSIKTNPNIDYAEYTSLGKGLNSSARVTDDGRIVISLNLKKALPDLAQDWVKDVHVEEYAVDETTYTDAPRLNVVIMIVGSRGDVQPYVALGQSLTKYGHRVRIATHETFRSFVREAGLEFFSIGGDPKDLMSYMVKNPGLIPGFESLINGDIGRKRKMLAEIMEGCWRSLSHPDDESKRTFAADAIISNPPAFAHIHCAEALGIPLLLTFTMPWSPTRAFPHPLVNIKQSNADKGLTNYLSYALTDILTWQGLGEVINTFRTKTLGLERLSFHSGPGLVDRLKIPWTYCLSPLIVPKPEDWQNHIDMVGFYFLESASDYKLPAELQRFLASGPSPVYIGFGSVVVNDSAAMTKTIFTAIEKAGVRALVSAGWGGLGTTTVPPNIFMITENVPHDQLFKHVSAVCHHGGAGTTAIGLRLGKPTIIVPFFGDQPFWGAMVWKAGAGPEPIPHKELTVDALKDAILFCVGKDVQAAAQKMGEQIRTDDGLSKGVDSFHRHLPLLNMRCDLDPSRVAVWWSNKYCLKLSESAAQILADAREINLEKLELHRSREYDTKRKVTDPISGGVGAIFWTITHYYSGIAQIFYKPQVGVINTATAIPRGMLNILTSVHEGFHNLPKLYGSTVREPGKVDSFSSGLKEGGLGFFHGYYDAITGLVTEPYNTGKKEGPIGVIKGSLRSFANATMKPAAGGLGLVAHPARGAWKSLQRQFNYKPTEPQRNTRVSNGVQTVKLSSSEQRQKVLEGFRVAKANVAERKKQMEKEGRRILKETKGLEPVDPEARTPVASSSAAEANAGSARSSVSQPEVTPIDEDATFLRDIDLAKRLSLAEQQGYERGVAERERRE